MSVQFGKCNFDGKPVNPEDLDEVRPVLAPYGPDGEGLICKGNFAVLYRAFHTTAESRKEIQPHVMRSEAVLTWDGRLDNRAELASQLQRSIPTNSTDVEIAAAAYEFWGTASFAKLIGDWAVSIWDPKTQTLILAKDIVGTRHLYYSIDKDRLTWCSVLDPLVLFAGHAFQLDEEYVAGWLGFFPAPHLTPYTGIRAVPPASLLRLTRNSESIRKYWDFNPSNRIAYQTDREYEDHFRATFQASLARRLRSDSPILAELSGGMDSSSIVCMSDRILRRGEADTIRLDTVSYYDDREPNWNERPYFTKVEEQRGRRGCHIDAGSYPLPLPRETGFLPPTPAAYGAETECTRQFSNYVAHGGHRILLSGIGGDEVTGGVPTPTPELADLLVRGHLKMLAQQLKRWALEKRRPWIHLLLEAIREFLPADLNPVPRHMRPAPWLDSAFVHRNKSSFGGPRSRTHLFGGLPSFQDSLSALDGLRSQLACDALTPNCVLEKRYPYLDRDLLEFIYAVPRQQLVRPGQRRSLMRRSLAGIVPEEILNRRRKAYVVRAHIDAIQNHWPELMSAMNEIANTSVGMVVHDAVSEALKKAREGGDVQMLPLMRTLSYEFWLRAALANGYVSGINPASRDASVGPLDRAHEPNALQKFQLANWRK